MTTDLSGESSLARSWCLIPEDEAPSSHRVDMSAMRPVIGNGHALTSSRNRLFEVVLRLCTRADSLSVVASVHWEVEISTASRLWWTPVSSGSRVLSSKEIGCCMLPGKAALEEVVDHTIVCVVERQTPLHRRRWRVSQLISSAMQSIAVLQYSCMRCIQPGPP